MTVFILLIYATMLCLYAVHTHADTLHVPPPGSRERVAILAALRTPVEQQLKKPVVFKVDYLKVQDGWAFLRGVPQQPDGRPMDYRGTVFEAAIQEGMFDDWICALLRQEAAQWRVITYMIGATDVPYALWDKEYQAPRAIFR